MKENNKLVFLYFSGVKIVEGPAFSLLIDINKCRYKRFDNQVLINITNCNNNYVKKENKDLITYLVENNWGHLTQSPELFENDLPEFFETPRLIDNCIIDIDNNKEYSIIKAIENITNLGCVAYQFRYYFPVTLREIRQTLNKLNGIGFEYVQFIIMYNEIDFEKILNSGLNIHVYACPKDVYLEKKDFLGENISISTSIETPNINCGFIGHYTVNIRHYTESLNFNTCLNKKVGIDIYGNIKNCPSSKRVYGNINDNSVYEIVISKDFQAMWDISKNKIDDCKICEFRHVCTDCRVYTKKNKLYGKPEKCNYDPYEGSWN